MGDLSESLELELESGREGAGGVSQMTQTQEMSGWVKILNYNQIVYGKRGRV